MSDIFEFPDGQGPKFPAAKSGALAEAERKAQEEQRALAVLKRHEAMVEAQRTYSQRKAEVTGELAASHVDYGYVWVGLFPRAWKRAAKELFGTPVKQEDHLRAYDVTGGWNSISHRLAGDATFFRISKQQAMVAKLARIDDATRIVEDPQGDIWRHLKVFSVAVKTLHQPDLSRAMNDGHTYCYSLVSYGKPVLVPLPV
jgi:hypothetical protein